MEATPADDLGRSAVLSNLGTGLSDRYAHTGVRRTSRLPSWSPGGALTPPPPMIPADRPSSATSELVCASATLVPGIPPTSTQPSQPSRKRWMSAASNAAGRAVFLANLGLACGTDMRRPVLWSTSIGHHRLSASARAHTCRDIPIDRATSTTWRRPPRPLRPHGILSDLEAAIAAFQAALEATPAASADRPMYLGNLGTGLRLRYATTGMPADLEAAIEVYRQAVDATPIEAIGRAGRLTNLGTGLNERYARQGGLSRS